MSRTLAVVLAAAALLGGTVASALPSTAATSPLRYVALGDSYSAASPAPTS